MRIIAVLRCLAQAALFPQACVLCERWVCNEDFSPLCRGCFNSLERLERRGCGVCGVPVPGSLLAEEDSALCSRCRNSPPPFDWAAAYGPFRGNLRRLIYQFKFEGRRHLAHPLARLLSNCLLPVGFRRPDWVIPVPTHPERRRERGFDHTLLLARELSRRLQLPLFSGLQRAKATIPQFGLDIAERECNLQGAFRIWQAEGLRGDILLVDDILTTGTTVSEVARLLKDQPGISSVGVVTVARVALLYLEE